MLNIIEKVFRLNRKKKVVKTTNFFELPSGQQKKIIKQAIREANEDQLELVNKYCEKHERLELRKCSN